MAAGASSRHCGYAGDGNFHLVRIGDNADASEMARAREVNERLVRRAIAMEGTCTGEHGVGTGKRDFLALELGPEAVLAMRDIERALDPGGLMNPGKVLTP